MPVITIDPLHDPRWDELVEHYSHASVFHTSGWLRALEQTYGYRPRILATHGFGRALQSALAFCEVSSWCTGRRLVSLPFSDHCEALLDSPTDAEILVGHLGEMRKRQRLRYIELRPRTSASLFDVDRKLTPYCDFVLHTVSLRAPLHEIFRNTHKECIQRKVRRAEKEALAYAVGREEILICQFYQLMIRTRRRHCLPPQPMKWFQNLVRCMGEKLAIHVAYQSGTPVAATLTLEFRKTLTYKYGCSDERFTKLGGNPFLFWKMFEYAKDRGMEEMDLGRSDRGEPGLITFKDRLGGVQEPLEYFCMSANGERNSLPAPWLKKIAKAGCGRAPDWLLVKAGDILYRHLG